MYNYTIAGKQQEMTTDILKRDIAKFENLLLQYVGKH